MRKLKIYLTCCTWYIICIPLLLVEHLSTTRRCQWARRARKDNCDPCRSYNLYSPFPRSNIFPHSAMPVGKTSKADTMTKSLSLLLNKVRPSQLRKILKLNFRLNENLRTLIIFTEMCAELASEHFKSGLRSRNWIFFGPSLWL